MGMLDFLTGGSNEDAASALRQAQAYLENVKTPTIQELTLPQLQQYVQAGLMTPAQMEAYLQKDNAYATEKADQTGTSAQIQAINQLSDVANSGANGTPVEQAQQAKTIQDMNQAVAGQRGAIEQAAQARGTPQGLIQAALSNQTAGQEAQQGYQNSLQSQAQAYQAAVDAMSKGSAAGQALQGQQNTQANTVAGAANAMQQFNAANQQSAAAANAANQQQANLVNMANKQDVSNQNTGLANTRMQYNAQVPETVFQNQFQKATGQANVAGQQANQATQAGQQEAGLWGGIIGAGATLAGGPVAGIAAKKAFDSSQGPKTGVQNAAHGGIILSHEGCYHDGGICMDDGGMVPGEAKMDGDSLQNDTVTAKLSPGEAVIPRSSVQDNMPQVLDLMAGGGQGSSQPVDPQDVATLLQAMRMLRGAA